MRYIVKLAVLLGIVLFPLQIWSQTGTIQGIVKDKKTGETIVGANVLIEGTTWGAATDIDGKFFINNLPNGEYVLTVSYVSYQKYRQEKVRVNAGKISIVNILLEENVSTLKEVSIEAIRKTDTELSVMSTIKSSQLVATGVSSQQIAKTQDRDASEVIKRITGISIIDNRFVMVRGLSERYNTVWLNNAATPSSETDVRAFSFDMIPSSLIDRMLIYKTPAPEFSGDFAGGVITIFTKNIPEKDQITLNYSNSIRPGTTGENFLYNYRGKYDWLGIEDGSRKLPDNFPKNLNQINTSSEQNSINDILNQLNQNWQTQQKIALPDQRISIGLAKRFDLGKVKIGNITHVNYSNSYSTIDFHRNYFLAYDSIRDCSDTSWSYNDVQYTNTAKFGGMFNWSFQFKNNQRIEIRNFLNHVGFTRTTTRNGYDEDNLQSNVRAVQFNFMERSIYSGQIAGYHGIKNSAEQKMEWNIGYSMAVRNEPDIKRLTFIKVHSDEDSPYKNQYYAVLSNFPDPRFAGRLFLNNKENLINSHVQYEQPFRLGSLKIQLKSGVYAEHKNRHFQARLLGYATGIHTPWTLIYQPIDSIFSSKNLNASTGITLQEKTNPSDSYESSSNLIAGYVAFNIPVTTKFNIYTGVRWEQQQQILNSFSSDYNRIPVCVDTTKIHLFPSANVTYNFNPKNLLRLAYGFTVNRPEFRELAPFAYYDFELAATVRGNAQLKDASIHNFDVRYEMYPTPNETFSIGCFSKYFINPIESMITPCGSDINYSFTNADFSTSMGVETEIKKSFANISSLKNFSLLLNAAWIKSNVRFTEFSHTSQTDRPMQGQSPYIINLGSFYQHDSFGLQFSILYNVIGKRIVFVGDMNTPDVYEMPMNLIDIAFSKKITSWLQLKGGIQDILNQTVRNTQFFSYYKNGLDKEPVKRSQNTLTYNRGRYFTLGISMSF